MDDQEKVGTSRWKLGTGERYVFDAPGAAYAALEQAAAGISTQHAMEMAAAMGEQHLWWIGDRILQMQEGGMGAMDSYRIVAQAMGKSVRWAFELAKVSRTFRKEDRVYEAPWGIYRAALRESDPVAVIRGAAALSEASQRTVGEPM